MGNEETVRERIRALLRMKAVLAGIMLAVLLTIGFIAWGPVRQDDKPLPGNGQAGPSSDAPPEERTGDDSDTTSQSNGNEEPEATGDGSGQSRSGKKSKFNTGPLFGVGNSPALIEILALDLPRIPWEGGPAYYSNFPKANAAGWDDPGFFPISVFLGSADPSIVDQYKDAGVNTYLAVQHSPGLYPISNITSKGLFAIPNLDAGNRPDDWTSAEVGNDTGVVGWFATDECEMGFSSCTLHNLSEAQCDTAFDTNDVGLTKLYSDRAECKTIAGKNAAECTVIDPDKYQDLDECLEFTYQKHLADQLRAKNDDRFISANFGNGIARTFWSPRAMDAHYNVMDFTAVDKYAYTSKSAAGVLDGAGFNSGSFDWPEPVTPSRSAAYGFMADQFKRFQDPTNRRPIGVMVETGKPLIADNDCWTPVPNCNIIPDHIEGAVWAAIIHEARHISYFSFSNGTACGEIANCPVVHAKVKSINEKIASLAPVLNTQSYYNQTYDNNGTTFYRYTFGNSTDTMLKTYGGSAYIFAGLGVDITGQDTNNCFVVDSKNACKNQGIAHGTGAKTFVLPAGVRGTTVTVVGEDRTIPVVNRSFTDSFANEYTHHVYEVAL